MFQFKKLRKIGSGTSGKTWKVEKISSGEIQCIKMISVQDKDEVDNEMQILSQLSHPNIVKFIGCFKEKNKIGIVMEFVDGEDLDKFVKRQKEPLQEKLIQSLFKEIVSALKHCHLRHIIHRDIKPSNIFLTCDLHVKLGDFGISTFDNSIKRQKSQGTPAYISPEILNGESATQESDLWSLGCVIYFMMTRKIAFQGNNTFDIINKIGEALIDPITENYTNDFRSLVSDLIVYAPEKRISLIKIQERFFPEEIEKERQIQQLYFEGLELKNSDQQVAIQKFRQAAEGGSSDAMLEIVQLLSGDERFEWYKKAADFQNGEANYQYGMYLYNKKNTVEAQWYFRRAAFQKHPAGINYYGVSLRDAGQSDTKSTEIAQLFKESADLGDSDGMNNYGTCLFIGYGVEKNEREGMRYYEMSMNAGNTDARNNYAQKLLTKNPEKQDKKPIWDAILLLEQNVQLGDSKAMNILGKLWEDGSPGEKKLDIAIKYYKMAMNTGNSMGKCNFARLQKLGVQLED